MREEKDDITIGDIFSKTGNIIRFLFSKWIILGIIGIIGGLLGIWYAMNQKPTYTANLTFVLSTDSKNSVYSGLASQFGLDMGGNGNDVFSGENIITLFLSKKMIREVLFKKPEGSNELLANIIVKDWEWDKKWAKDDYTKNLFPFPEDLSKVSPLQDSLLSEIHDQIIKNVLTVARTDKKLSVFSVTTKSTNALFSCYLTLYLMDETAKFYIETKMSLARENLRMIQHEADSLRGLLSGAITTTAAEADRTFALNPAMQVQRAPAQRGQVRAGVLATAYGEVTKNLLMAKINLQKETPLYQVIDTPRMPLKKVKKSKIIYGVLGAIILVSLTSLVLLLRRK